MSPSNPPPKPEESSNLIPIIILGAAVLIFAIVMKSLRGDDPNASVVLKPNTPKVDVNTPQFRAKVNEILQKMDRDRELRRMEQEVENRQQEEKIGSQLIKPPPLQGPVGYEMKQDSKTEDVAKDVRTPSQLPNFRRDIDDHISYRLQMNQMLRDYDKIYQQEYIKAFIQNAREAGYDVRVDKDLNVTVEPLKK